jgi:hypothetical protein
MLNPPVIGVANALPAKTQTPATVIKAVFKNIFFIIPY